MFDLQSTRQGKTVLTKVVPGKLILELKIKETSFELLYQPIVCRLPWLAKALLDTFLYCIQSKGVELSLAAAPIVMIIAIAIESPCFAHMIAQSVIGTKYKLDTV